MVAGWRQPRRVKWLAGGDAIGEVVGIVVDEAEQGRAAGVLPRQAEEVQARYLGDAAPMGYLPAEVPGPV
jgi:hypothetical protein